MKPPEFIVIEPYIASPVQSHSIWQVRAITLMDDGRTIAKSGLGVPLATGNYGACCKWASDHGYYVVGMADDIAYGSTIWCKYANPPLRPGAPVITEGPTSEFISIQDYGLPSGRVVAYPVVMADAKQLGVNIGRPLYLPAPYRAKDPNVFVGTLPDCVDWLAEHGYSPGSRSFQEHVWHKATPTNKEDDPVKTNLTTYEIAKVCYEAVRAYCESLGDMTRHPWHESEPWAKEQAVACAKFVLSNLTIGGPGLHAHWMSNKLAAGWKYGPQKSAIAKTHPSLKPWDQLPATEQVKNLLFANIVYTFRGMVKEF
jgi:hypothetical protein